MTMIANALGSSTSLGTRRVVRCFVELTHSYPTVVNDWNVHSTLIGELVPELSGCLHDFIPIKNGWLVEYRFILTNCPPDLVEQHLSAHYPMLDTLGYRYIILS